MNKHAKPLQLPKGERGAFTLDPMTSPTLPSRYYTDESIYRAEMRQIHQKSWCYVGHVCEVAEPGMYFTDVVGEQPVLVARDTDPIGLQAVSGIMASCVLLPVLLIFGGIETGPAALRLVMPSGQDWALLIGVGLLGTVGHLLMTWSLRFAPSATLAPMQYLEIPFATLIGWLIWRDLPDGLAAIGILITVASGLYIVLRERQLTRAGAKMASAAQSQP